MITQQDEAFKTIIAIRSPLFTPSAYPLWFAWQEQTRPELRLLCMPALKSDML
ncbi:hypothetical protein ACFLVX_00100 [Chloroflexota bacterium]